MERPPEHDAPPPSPQPTANGSPPPVPAADADALRGTRFEFGGRRPYSFTPPRVTAHAPTRPLPGIGTVALGKVTRIVPYGAFVDFLGFRGMIHVSQLQPGQRVERVEDVVQLNDEVQVRVIGVDPERRHINLTLVAKLAPSDASPSAAPEAPAPPAVEAKPEPIPETPPVAPETPPIVAEAAPRAITRLTRRVAPRPAQRPAPKPPAPKPTAPVVAQHGARAIRRELVDPRHPMARLLASAPEAVVRPPADKERARPADEVAIPPQPAAIAPPQPPPVHVFGPDPEPEEEQPATLEALAARFAHRREAAGTKPATKTDRSRAEREKQAQILAKLREDAAKFAK